MCASYIPLKNEKTVCGRPEREIDADQACNLSAIKRLTCIRCDGRQLANRKKRLNQAFVLHTHESFEHLVNIHHETKACNHWPGDRAFQAPSLKSLFVNSAPQGALLSGDAARGIFRYRVT